MSGHIPAYLFYSTTLSLHLLTVSFLEHVITSDNTNHEFLHRGEPCFPHFSRTAGSQSLLQSQEMVKGSLIPYQTCFTETSDGGDEATRLEPCYSIAALDQVNKVAFSSWYSDILTNPFHIQVRTYCVCGTLMDPCFIYILLSRSHIEISCTVYVDAYSVVVSSPLLTRKLCCIRAPELTLHSFLGWQTKEITNMLGILCLHGVGVFWQSAGNIFCLAIDIQSLSFFWWLMQLLKPFLDPLVCQRLRFSMFVDIWQVLLALVVHCTLD